MKAHTLLQVMQLAAMLLALQVYPAWCRDWFIRAGAENGDGSKERPFGDPYVALDRASSGDVIHVAAGTYHGKLGAASWVIASPNISMIGGYNTSFTERDPWKTPSELAFDSTSPVPRAGGSMVEGRSDHANFIFDGFVVNGRYLNRYKEPGSDLASFGREPLLFFSSPGVEIRNSAILNGAGTGVLLGGDGSKLENNIVANVANGDLVRLSARSGKSGISVRGNTLAFSWSRSFGTGEGSNGLGLRIDSSVKADVRDNIFAHCGNYGIALVSGELLSVNNNVFWMNGFANLRLYIDTRPVSFGNANMGRIAEAGFLSATGNQIADPQLSSLPAAWLKRYIDAASAKASAVSSEDWEKLRATAGLLPGSDATGFAMPLEVGDAIQIRPAGLKQGAHPVVLPVRFGPAEAVVVHDYETSTWDQFLNDRNLKGKRIEFPTAMGQGQQFFPFPGITEAEYYPVTIYDMNNQRTGQTALAYVRKGTPAHRIAFERGSLSPGSALPVYLVRGVVMDFSVPNVRQKRTFVIESIAPYN